MPSINFQYTPAWVAKNAHVVSKFLNFLKSIELEKMNEDGTLYSIVPGYESIWELMTELKPKVSQDFESTTRKLKLKNQKRVDPVSNDKKVQRKRPRIKNQESTGFTPKKKMASSSSMQLSESSAKVLRKTSRANQARQELSFTIGQSSPSTTHVQTKSSQQSKSSTMMETQLSGDKADKVMTVTMPQPSSSMTSRRTRSMNRVQRMISKKARTKKPTKSSRSKLDTNQEVVLQKEIQTTLETSKSSTTVETQLSDNQADQVLPFMTPELLSSMTSRQTTLNQAVEETNQKVALRIEIQPALEALTSLTLESQLPDNEDDQEVTSTSEQAVEEIKQETPLNEVNQSASETFISSTVNSYIDMILMEHLLLNNEVSSKHSFSTQQVSNTNENEVIDPLDLLTGGRQSSKQEMGPEIFSLEETEWQWLDKV